MIFRPGNAGLVDAYYPSINAPLNAPPLDREPSPGPRRGAGFCVSVFRKSCMKLPRNPAPRTAPAPSDNPDCHTGARSGGHAVQRQPTVVSMGAPKKTVETRDFAAMVARQIRAYGRRVATGDLESLAELVKLRGELDQAIDAAAAALHAGSDGHAGYSWTDIGRVLGMTRQAARQRFATPHDD